MSNDTKSSTCCGNDKNCASTPVTSETCCCDTTRRDFLYMTTGTMAAIGTGGIAWPFISQLNPAADTLAMSTTEVDLSQIAEGQAITVMWRGKPVFIRHRTAEEIAAAKDVDISTLRDKEDDKSRVQRDKWLVVVGVCTHLGCVPLGQKNNDTRGEYDGWFCPCHGSQYDTSGRIRKGPAPKNLQVPTYSFLSDTLIRIG